MEYVEIDENNREINNLRQSNETIFNNCKFKVEIDSMDRI